MDLKDRLETFLRRGPTLGEEVFIAPGAVVVGDVTLGDRSSVWFNAVLRGDINRIVIGRETNIQDLCMVHLSNDRPCLVGDECTVGHSAILHACTVGHRTLVGMGAVLLDGAVIGDECIIGARALVTQDTVVPSGSMVLGSPATVVRPLTPAERAWAREFSAKYVEVSRHHRRHGDAAPRPGK